MSRNPRISAAMHEAAKHIREVADELDETADDERFTDLQAVLDFSRSAEKMHEYMRFSVFLRDFLIELMVPPGPGG